MTRSAPEINQTSAFQQVTSAVSALKRIVLPGSMMDIIIEHCRMKLNMIPSGDTPEEKKAFGLLAGKISGTEADLHQCFPLKKNARNLSPYKEYMDEILNRFAVPSVTPLDRRGWVADPHELLEKIRLCHLKNNMLLGTYHMHRVSWDHDLLRDTPTKLDDVLAEKSGLVMFIVSMVNPEKPIIRAFYEGKIHHEIPISVDDSR